MLQLVVRFRALYALYFFVLCADGYAPCFPIPSGVVGVVGFLVSAVLVFVLGWHKRFFCPIRLC